jgi:hypothetical protein
MLNIRLVTTAKVEARWTAEIEDTELGHGTAILSRLVQPCAGTGRIICADFILPASRQLRSWEVWVSSSLAL